MASVHEIAENPLPVEATATLLSVAVVAPLASAVPVPTRSRRRCWRSRRLRWSRRRAARPQRRCRWPEEIATRRSEMPSASVRTVDWACQRPQARRRRLDRRAVDPEHGRDVLRRSRPAATKVRRRSRSWSALPQAPAELRTRASTAPPSSHVATALPSDATAISGSEPVAAESGHRTPAAARGRADARRDAGAVRPHRGQVLGAVQPAGDGASRRAARHRLDVRAPIRGRKADRRHGEQCPTDADHEGREAGTDETASGTHRVDHPLVCVPRKEDHPTPSARRGANPVERLGGPPVSRRPPRASSRATYSGVRTT